MEHPCLLCKKSGEMAWCSHPGDSITAKISSNVFFHVFFVFFVELDDQLRHTSKHILADDIISLIAACLPQIIFCYKFLLVTAVIPLNSTVQQGIKLVFSTACTLQTLADSP